jgi:thiol-disulfide isomerase/thioredoxin
MKYLAALFLSLLSFGAMFAADQPLELSDAAGKKHTPLVVGDHKAVVLVFVSPYCPTSNAFTPEINRIAADYGDRFAFYLVEADGDITLADTQKHIETMEIKAPVLLDPGHRLALLTKAKTTPEAVVLGPKGEPLYQGRINDLYASQTKKLKEPKTHDLRVALDAIAAGQPVAVPTTKAIGCSISGI